MGESSMERIQDFLFSPEENIFRELYWKTKSKIPEQNNTDQFSFPANTEIDFCTLFNCFSLKKWKKYTYLRKLAIELKFSGIVRVQVFQYTYTMGNLRQIMIEETVIENEGYIYPKFIGEPDLCGIKVLAITDCILHSGSYMAVNASELLSKPCIALNICTFHREEQLERNLKKIVTEIFDDPKNLLNQYLHVFITDNGNSYCTTFSKYKQIHVFHRNELGSAGGFTSGVVEILSQRKEIGCTHQIFMDDDIVLSPKVLERTYLFLRWIRPEFYEYMIGGAFMCIDAPMIQLESGARWNGGDIESIKSNLDMTLIESLVKNEIDADTEYFGWWYSCVPLVCFEKRGLPVQVYFHRDDVEFGLRNPLQLTLNGICVWHQSFKTKPSSVNKYYDIRNLAIVNAIHLPSYNRWQYIKRLWKEGCKEIARYRYKEAKLLVLGAKDFCKGKEWVIANDSGKYFDQLKNMGYSFSDISEFISDFDLGDYIDDFVPKKKIIKYIQMFFLNGMLFPSNTKKIVPAFEPCVELFWRTKYILNYNSFDRTGYLTKRDFLLSLQTVVHLLIGSVLILFKYQKAAESWRKGKLI